MFRNRFDDISYYIRNIRLRDINISEIPKKYIISCIVGIVVLSCGTFLVFNKKDTKIGVLEVKVKTYNYLNEDTIELINEGEKYSKVYHNGELKEDTPLIPSKGKAMELPVIQGVLDIEKNEKVQELTYKATLEESAKYINFLLKKGYTILREAYTSDYIEFYMTKGTKERRIIILNNIIIVGELGESWKMPDVSSYFE